MNKNPWSDHWLSPRDWQKKALCAVLASLDTPRKKGAVIQAVMGAGKSVLLAELVRCTLSALSCTVVVAPKRMLVKQLAATLSRRLGPESVGKFFGGEKSPHRAVVVTCSASLPRLRDVLLAAGRSVNLMIFDEAHRSETVKTLDAVRDLAPVAVLGFTATPWRSKASERLSLFDDVVFSYGFHEAIRDGVLCPYRVVTWTDERARAAGLPDDADRDLVCWEMIKGAQGPGLISADSVADARQYKEFLCARGFPVDVIAGGTKDDARKKIMAALEAGTLRAVIHVNVLSEGADFPYLRWVCLRRAASSKVRFPQEVGRVLRAHPGKKIATVYDPHALSLIRGLSESADLWRPAKIIVLMPQGAKKIKATERWLRARDFTCVVHTDAADGFDNFFSTLVGRQIGQVLVYDAESLDPAQRQWVQGASAEWGSDRLVRIRQVVPTAPDRAVALWIASDGPAGQRQALTEWVARLGKVAVATVEHSPGTDAAGALRSAGLWASPGDGDGVQYGALLCLNKSLVPPAVRSRVLDTGRRLVEVRPAARQVSALALPTGEAWLHEVHVLLSSMGLATRGPASVWARTAAPTDAQVTYLDTLRHSVRAWQPPGPPAVLDRLRPLVVAGLGGHLPLGVMSDLIGVLKGLERAGGWVLGEL